MIFYLTKLPSRRCLSNRQNTKHYPNMDASHERCFPWINKWPTQITGIMSIVARKSQLPPPIWTLSVDLSGFCADCARKIARKNSFSIHTFIGTHNHTRISNDFSWILRSILRWCGRNDQLVGNTKNILPQKNISNNVKRFAYLHIFP